MATSVEFRRNFLRELKQLDKKYPSATHNVEALANELENDERPSDKIPNVGYDVYKVRLSNPSAGKGKSGGFRVV